MAKRTRELLEGAERTAALARVPLWREGESRDCIQRDFVFDNFDTAFFHFMTAVGREAEKADHHPEWFNVYNKVNITLATHTASGVTEKDIALAAFCDKLAEELQQQATKKQ